MPKRKQILKQMFDVRPTKADGSLDLEKIKKSDKTVIIAEDRKYFEKPKKIRKFADISSSGKPARVTRPRSHKPREIPPVPEATEAKISRRPRVIHMGREAPADYFSVSRVVSSRVFTDSDHAQSVPENETGIRAESPVENSCIAPAALDYEKSAENLVARLEIAKRKKRKRKSKRKKAESKVWDRDIEQGFTETVTESLGGGHNFGYAFSFASVLLIFSLIIPCFGFVQRSLEAKTSILNSSQRALGQFAAAKDNMASGQFEKASVNFEESYQILNQANRDVSEIGGKFSEVLRFIPGISKVASANYVTAAGENLALAGKYLTSSAKSLNSLGNPLDAQSGDNQPSLTDIFLNLRDAVGSANAELVKAQDNIEKINIADLPEDVRPKFLELKDKLPIVTTSLGNFLDYSQIFLDVLGYNGPRKFLFLFQNNQEMRATGGFIGSYGILDISNGRIKKLFVDDIYNPDGQLKARVIPPEPIQKMSAVWTMHDANWFPDFPTSAEKVSWFYEKTGGPTVDGIIAITPSVLQSLLEITGPIDMPEYETSVDKDNFIEKTQNEVENDYDKELNQPKKFIADLTPKILDKVFNLKNPASLVKVLQIFNASLKEKQILIYSKNYNIEKLVSRQGWSGEILNTSKDYLSVINTNINGYKTDGVIDETIHHAAEIQDDGSIIDTVTVIRKHNGGNEKYDWWNKVNGDYMRVYVPENSQLLEVSGQTRETVNPPLDYQTLGFRKDPQLASEEESIKVDDQSGTRIYTENHKTVFANWTYVSPGESVTIEYKYRLPFKLSFDDLHHPADSFSVLFQKQSGSAGSHLVSEIKMPQNFQTVWRWPDDIKDDSGNLKMETVLDTDRFIGAALEKKQ